MKKFIASMLFVLLLMTFSGCTSGRVNITGNPPPDNFQKLGQVTGEACGTIGLLATAYYFIPFNLNSRYERAYEEALSKAPGATGLVDVTISEDWYWWVLVTARCVKITAEAIK